MSGHDSYWEELPCGIYSIKLKALKGSDLCLKEKIIGQVRKHAWPDPLVNKLVKWERTKVDLKEVKSSLHAPPCQKVVRYLCYLQIVHG